jgi:hypothetical protein
MACPDACAKLAERHNFQGMTILVCASHYLADWVGDEK